MAFKAFLKQTFNTPPLIRDNTALHANRCVDRYLALDGLIKMLNALSFFTT